MLSLAGRKRQRCGCVATDARPATASGTPTRTEALIEKIVEEVCDKGWSVQPGFLTPEAVGALRSEAMALWTAGRFVEARVRWQPCYSADKLLVMKNSV